MTATAESVRGALAGLLALPDVRRVGLALTEGGGRRLRFTASDRDPRGEVDWCFIDAYDDVPLTTVARTGEPVVGALDDLDPRYSGLVERQRADGTAALAAIPIPGPGSPLGGVVLFYATDQDFSPAQRDDLARRADDLARAVRGDRAVEPRVETHPGPDELDVDADPRSVRTARRFAREHLEAWGVPGDDVETAVLCLSELVTNAVVHTGSPSRVSLALDHGVVTVAVRDHGGADAPTEVDLTADPLRVHGRGLALVDALAARWGAERDAAGTTVWFVLEL